MRDFALFKEPSFEREKWSETGRGEEKGPLTGTFHVWGTSSKVKKHLNKHHLNMVPPWYHQPREELLLGIWL